MHPPLFIGLDIGTTACKAVAIDDAGKVRAAGSGEYPLHAPRADVAEQRIDEIWTGVTAALRELIAKIDTTQLRAIGLSGAMHSLMPVLDDGTPLRPAMTWADNRAVEKCIRVARPESAKGVAGDPCPTATPFAEPQGVPPDAGLYERTGCPQQWLYHAPRLRWLREHETDAFARAARFVAIKDWVLHRLTGRWGTDTCLASSTGLLDIRSRTWDEAAVNRAAVDVGRLPSLLQPTQQAGAIAARAAAETNLPQGMPVYPGGSDGGMANLGAGATSSGQVVITVGTSGAVRVTTDRPILDPQQRTWCYCLTRDLWFAGGAINNGGLAIDWVRRTFYADLPKDEAFACLFSDAEETEGGAEGVLMLPYFTGERTPHWRPDLRASLVNLEQRHERRHIARAALESVAYCLAEVYDIVAPLRASRPRAPGAGPLEAALPGVLTGGIVKSRLWSQIVCDVLGVPLQLNEAGDASAIGAAMIAQAGRAGRTSVKPFDSAEQVIALEPDMKLNERYAKSRGAFQQEVLRCL